MYFLYYIWLCCLGLRRSWFRRLCSAGFLPVLSTATNNVNATNERHFKQKKKQNNLKNGTFFELKIWFILTFFFIYQICLCPKSDLQWWFSMISLHIFDLKIWLFWQFSWFVTFVNARNLIYNNSFLYFCCIFLSSNFDFYWPFSLFKTMGFAQYRIYIDSLLIILLHSFELKIWFILTNFFIRYTAFAQHPIFNVDFLWFQCMFLSSKSGWFWKFSWFVTYFNALCNLLAKNRFWCVGIHRNWFKLIF